MGHLILEGGAEFNGRMSEPDLRAMELAGGKDAPICILPTAAAPDKNHRRAGNYGTHWFLRLGAKHVSVVDVIDKRSANDPALAAQIRDSKLIYLLGGFPRFLCETLRDSLCWSAALEAFGDGAALAGSSAGAMVMCEHYYDPHKQEILRGLNLLPNACVVPHFSTYGKHWVASLGQHLPDVTLIGIDERTGMVSTDFVPDGEWEVLGGGEVTVYRGGATVRYGRGERFSFGG